MPGTLTETTGSPPPPDIPELPWGGDGPDRDRPERGGSRSASLTGIIVLMCASTMTFAALISAMVVRRGLNNDWGHVALPQILWWNTGAIVISSVLLDVARRKLRSGNRQLFNWLWSAGAVLGTGFLIGQATAWQQLSNRGFYAAGHPSTAFFYVLTWTHAAHVVGTLLPVLYVMWRALRYELGPGRRTMVEVSAAFWHFLDVMWLAIMALYAFWA